jgi:hypothetical protein
MGDPGSVTGLMDLAAATTGDDGPDEGEVRVGASTSLADEARGSIVVVWITPPLPECCRTISSGNACAAARVPMTKRMDNLMRGASCHRRGDKQHEQPDIVITDTIYSKASKT